MDDKSAQEASASKNSPTEVDSDTGMGLFPQVKYAVRSRAEGEDAISELLKNLAFISSSDGPLKMQLPAPVAMRSAEDCSAPAAAPLGSDCAEH